MKAVAAGAEPDGHGGWANEDTLALRAASTLAVPPELDNPVLLPDPMSPHIAAQRAGRSIEIAHIVDSYRSEEHTSELQSPCNLVCRLLLEKKKKIDHP